MGSRLFLSSLFSSCATAVDKSHPLQLPAPLKAIFYEVNHCEGMSWSRTATPPLCSKTMRVEKVEYSDCIFIAIIICSFPSPSSESSVVSWHPQCSERPLWRTHKPVHYPHPSSNIRCCQGVCGRLFLTTERQQESGEDGQRKGEGKGEMGYNCILRQFRWQQPMVFFSLPVRKCARQLPEHPNAMATASGGQCESALKGGEKRGEASPSPSQADMWCSCWAVTRTHHTHRLCSHPPMCRLKIAPPSSPLSPSFPHYPPLTCQFLSRLPLANRVINLSVCLPPWQNQWAVLGAGVDTAAAYKARATWVEHTVTSGPLTNFICAFVNLVTTSVREDLKDGCNALPMRKQFLSLQSQSMGNCKQKFPENLSVRCSCACSSLERWGGDQSFPERIPDYPPTEGKNQKQGGRMQDKSTKRERERESGGSSLYNSPLHNI